MQEVFEGFHDFLKSKYNDVATKKNAGTPDVDDYADTNKSRLREEVKKDLDPGADYNERLKYIVKAQLIRNPQLLILSPLVPWGSLW